MDELEQRGIPAMPSPEIGEVTRFDMEPRAPQFPPYVAELGDFVNGVIESGGDGTRFHISKLLDRAVGVRSLPQDEFAKFIGAIRRNEHLHKEGKGFYQVYAGDYPGQEVADRPSDDFGSETVHYAGSLEAMLRIMRREAPQGKKPYSKRRVHIKRHIDP